MLIIKESVDAIPIATVPGNSVNEATSIAITAIDKAGTNIFKPNFLSFHFCESCI